jgi:uncharacterized protein (DUF983 family)
MQTNARRGFTATAHPSQTPETDCHQRHTADPGTFHPCYTDQRIRFGPDGCDGSRRETEPLDGDRARAARPLFRAYLKQVDSCRECNEAWCEIRTDDAAPWLTILIVGHVMAPVLVAMSKSGRFSPWEMTAILVPVLVAICLLILPRAKALFMAAIWALRAQSS